MCDISIHDGGSSQITMGPQGAMLSPMENDPIYVSDMFQQINRIKIRKIEVHVPILLKLIDQQLLAFSNVLMKRDNKCIIIYNRLRYIQFVLAPRNINRPRLLAIFGISEQIVNPIIVNIDKELNRIISEQCSNNTGELCMKLNKYEQESKKEYLQEYEELRQAHEMQQRALQLQHFQQQQQLQQYLAQQQRMRPKSQVTSPHKPSPISPTKAPAQSRRRLNVNKNNKERKERIKQVISLADVEKQRRINNMTRRRMNNKQINNQEKAARIQQAIELAETERRRRIREENATSTPFHTPPTTPSSTPFHTPRQSPRSLGGRKMSKRH